MAHAHWAESNGRFASIEELEAQLAAVKLLPERIESQGREAKTLPGEKELETQPGRQVVIPNGGIDMPAMVPHEEL